MLQELLIAGAVRWARGAAVECQVAFSTPVAKRRGGQRKRINAGLVGRAKAGPVVEARE